MALYASQIQKINISDGPHTARVSIPRSLSTPLKA
jgi:hypothetical protein